MIHRARTQQEAPVSARAVPHISTNVIRRAGTEEANEARQQTRDAERGTTQAQQEAERLRELLRAAGIDPDQAGS